MVCRKRSHLSSMDRSQQGLRAHPKRPRKAALDVFQVLLPWQAGQNADLGNGCPGERVFAKRSQETRLQVAASGSAAGVTPREHSGKAAAKGGIWDTGIEMGRARYLCGAPVQPARRTASVWLSRGPPEVASGLIRCASKKNCSQTRRGLRAAGVPWPISAM